MSRKERGALGKGILGGLKSGGSGIRHYETVAEDYNQVIGGIKCILNY